jgi:two-component system sensor histidine kinase DevS
MGNQMTGNRLEQRLSQLHQFSLKIIQFSSLEHLLEQIASIACQQSGASSASVNLLIESSKLGKAMTVRSDGKNCSVVENPAYAQSIFQSMMQVSTPARFPPEYRAKLVGLASQNPDVLSFLYVPILQGTRLIGQILVINKLEERSFTAADQVLLETLARYAEIGITNALLRARLTQRDHSLSRRNENLALLNELAATLSSSSEIDIMLEEILVQVVDSLKLAAGELFLCREDSNLNQMVMHYGDAIDHFWSQSEFELGSGTVGKTAQSGQPTVFDLYEDDIEDLNESMYQNRIQQIGCFPLMGRNGSLGVLCIATCKPQPLDALELQFLTIISSWVGTVIENARLNLQQRRMAVLEERKRIGMDLHDGIIQSIYAVGLTLEHARLLMNEDHEKADERIDQAIQGLNSTIRDLRSYILDLRPHYLHDENLMQGIQRLVNEFRVNTLVEVDLRGSFEEFENLPEVHALALFHICQESLANIAKHARASHVSVSLWTAAGRALLEVHDDGRGFDMNDTKRSLGHGLSNMQIRAHNVNGDVDIITEPNEGTTVLAWVPFAKTVKSTSPQENPLPQEDHPEPK